MKSHPILILLFAAILSASFPAAVAAQSTDALFQQAQRLERVQGDYQGAIGVYEQIVGAVSSDRASVARALVQMGKAYESLGRTEAFSIYERVVRDFTDLTEQVTEARSRMQGLAAPTTTVIPVRAPGEITKIPFNSTDEFPIYDYGIDMSRDGRFLASIGGGGKAFIHEISTGENTAIATECRTSTMRFSPDGATVAYGCFYHGGVGIYDLNSGKTRQIMDGFTYVGVAEAAEVEIEIFDWTEDGDSIVVSIEGPGMPEGDQTQIHHIILLPVDGGKPRIIDPEYWYENDGEGNFFWENNACLMRNDRFLFGDWQRYFDEGNDPHFIQSVSTVGAHRQDVLYNKNANYTIAGCDKKRHILYYSASIKNMNTTLWAAFVEEDGSLSNNEYLQDLPEEGWAWAHPFNQDGNLYYTIQNTGSFQSTWTGRLEADGAQAYVPEETGRILDWSDDGRFRASQWFNGGVFITDTQTGAVNNVSFGQRIRTFAWFPNGEQFMVSMWPWPFGDHWDFDVRTWIYEAESGALVDSVDGIHAFGTDDAGESILYVDDSDNGVCVTSMKLSDRTRTELRCFPEAEGLPELWFGSAETSRSRKLISLTYRVDSETDPWRTHLFSLDGSVDYELEESDPDRGIEFLPDDSGVYLVDKDSILKIDFQSGIKTEIRTGLGPGYSFEAGVRWSFQAGGLSWELHPDGVQFETRLDPPDPEPVLWVINNVAGLFKMEN